MSENPILEAPGTERSRGAHFAGETAAEGLGDARIASPVALRLFFVIGAALAILYWLVESAAHTWVLHEDSFVANLLPGDPNELWMRLLTVGLLLAGGAISAAFAKRLTQLAHRNEVLQRRLNESLAKLLNGFIPLCMYCKSVRNPDESWVRIEAYLASRTDLQLSHGICPSCYSKHFRDDA